MPAASTPSEHSDSSTDDEPVYGNIRHAWTFKDLRVACIALVPPLFFSLNAAVYTATLCRYSLVRWLHCA